MATTSKAKGGVSPLNGDTPDELAPRHETFTIHAPKFQQAEYELEALPDVPLVIHRFSAKLKNELKQKMETGKAAGSKKNREPKDMDQAYEDARYRSKEGWDGFHAGALRKGLIEACRLVGFKMVLAKLS